MRRFAAKTMKRKDISDLKTKTVAELSKLADDLGVQIAKAQMDLATRKNKNTNFAANMKQRLATILSIRREMEIYAKH